MRKNQIRISLLLSLMFVVVFTLWIAQTFAADFTATINPGSVIQSNWFGLGVEWANYPHCDTTNTARGYTYGPLTDAQWNRIVQRLDALKPGFIRFMIHTGWTYFNNLDSYGNPVVDYNSAEMQFLYKCLDYCQSRNITLLFGEWSPRWKMSSGQSSGSWVYIWSDYNSTWANMIADFLNQLIVVKGYTCIKYYDMENEAYGSWAYSAGNWSKYKNGFILLDTALKNKGIRNRIKLDCCWNGMSSTQVSEIAPYADVYDEHQYGSPSNTNDYASAKNTRMNSDLSADGMWLGECGINGTVDYSYSHTASDSAAGDAMGYDYGWWMANRAVQAMRDGLLTVDAWMLDDAMHTAGDNGIDLKRWGMWDSMGSAYSGNASLENLRPWFYSWAIIGNNFPSGSKILSTSNNTNSGVSTIGASTPAGKYSVAIVNNNSTAKSVNVVISNGPTAATVQQFNDFSNDQPKDANGFPIPKQTLTGINFQTGFTVNLPSAGVVVLSIDPSPTPIGTNLAINKPAVASSVEAAGLEAVYAVDGNSTTRWSSAYSDPQWVYVDLGASNSINRVRLNWEAAYGKSYSIQVSNDASGWTNVYSTTTGDGGLDDISFTATNARYVRMYGTVRATTYGYSLYDFEVYGSGTGPTPTPTTTPTPTASAPPTASVQATPTPTSTPNGSNLALNKTATASTALSGYPASYANDSSASTRWCALDGAMPQWWRVDLGANYSISSTTITLAPAGASFAYQIGVSTDGTNYTTVVNKTSYYSGAQTDNFTAVTARYVRVYFTGSGTSDWASLSDVQVFGSSSATPTPTSTPSSGNLALNKSAVCSSTDDATRGATKAVDGNTSTRWASAWAVDPQWIYVDLGAVNSIKHVKLNWEAAYGKSYNIQVSNDASSWTTVYSTTTGDGGIDDITFTATNARYVRMYGTVRALSQYGYSLWEFEVYSN